MTVVWIILAAYLASVFILVLALGFVLTLMLASYGGSEWEQMDIRDMLRWLRRTPVWPVMLLAGARASYRGWRRYRAG